MSGRPYVLGIDLGTAYTAAAVSRGGRSEIVPFSSAGAVLPTVVVLREDGEVLVGDAAERRSLTEPGRTAREFKRRMGDATPIIVGETPYGAEALAAHVLRAVATEVAAREGGRPQRVVLTHPASWGMFKLDLLRQAAAAAELGPVETVSEPEAAAVHYAGLERIEAGQVVAVYDLGGGTFDAAVLRRTETGFQTLGTPEGMERFGGIDVDRAVLGHVDRCLDGLLTEQATTSDPAVRMALARLRDDARAAKEALSSDTDATIPVMLPSLATDVRITRGELEAMLRPRLIETVDTMERTLRSAGLTWADVSRVLTVGGSSRMPIVREVLRERSGRSISSDAQPKHAVALGAADVAAMRWRAASATDPSRATASPPPPPPTLPVAPVAAAPASRGRRPGWVIPAAAAVAVLVAGGAIVALTGSSDGGPAVAASEGQRATSTTTIPAATLPVVAAPATTLAETTLPAGTQPAVTLPANTLPASTVPPVTTVPATTAPATVPVSTLVPPGVVPVVDATGSFQVDVPTSFTSRTQPIPVGSTTVAQVSAAADIDRYLAGDWSAVGFSVVVGELTASSGAAQVLALFDPGATCTASTGQQPYTAVQGTGVIARYDGCGGIGAGEVLVAIEVPALQAFVFIGAQGPAPSDGALLTLAEGVLATVRQP